MANSDKVKDKLRQTVERQLSETDPGNPGATSSPAEESPVQPEEVSYGASGAGDQTATDATAATPKGVGTSTTRRGEDVVKEEGKEPGRTDTGTQGRSQRPVGTSDARDLTGIDPQNPAD